MCGNASTERDDKRRDGAEEIDRFWVSRCWSYEEVFDLLLVASGIKNCCNKRAMCDGA